MGIGAASAPVSAVQELLTWTRPGRHSHTDYRYCVLVHVVQLVHHVVHVHVFLDCNDLHDHRKILAVGEMDIHMTNVPILCICYTNCSPLNAADSELVVAMQIVDSP